MKELINNWRIFLKEEKAPRVNVFLDMDGVLVDFPGALKTYIKDVYAIDADVLHPGSKSSRRVLRKLQGLQLSDEEIEELYDQTESKFQSGEAYAPAEKIMNNYTFKALFKNKNLWLIMDKLENADQLVDTVFNLADEVFVLSAGVDETSEEAKKEWIAHHFPQINTQNVNISRAKGQRLLDLANQGAVSMEDINILIDDRTPFIDDFEGAGGLGIKYDFTSPQKAIEQLEILVGEAK